MSNGINTFLRLLQGQQQAAPVPAANMQRPYQLPGGGTPPMALSGLQKAQAAQLARGTGGPAPRVLPMLANVAQGKYISPLQKALMQQEAEQPAAPTTPQGAPAQTTFGQRYAQPTTQALLGAAIQGADASGWSPVPVSTGQVLARMGAGAMGGYQAAEDRIAAQKAASQKSVIDRLLAEAQFAKAMRPDTTSLMKNLAAAGIDPNSPEGQKIIRDALTKPGTTIMTGGESEFLKEGIKSGFATIKEAQKDIKTDATLAPRVMQIIDLIEGGAETGRIQSATMGLRQLGKELGFLSEEQVSKLRDQEVLRSAMSYMVPRMRVTGSGASSDRDMEFFAQAAPMMTNTPEGNLIIAKMFKQLMDYNKKRLTLMGSTLKKEKNLLGFEEAADQQLGAFYQRAKTQKELDDLVESGAIKEGDVFYNGLAGEFQILGRD